MGTSHIESDGGGSIQSNYRTGARRPQLNRLLTAMVDSDRQAEEDRGVTDMSDDPHLFSVEAANRTLPLVRVIVRDLAEVSQRVAETGRRLEYLTSGRDLSAEDPYEEELAEMRRTLTADSEQVNVFIKELLELGIEPDEAVAGVVDFPAELDGRVVSLCWKYDEPELLFWREPGAPFDERQPLTAGSLPDGSGSDNSFDL